MLERIVGWLRAGYPQGVPSADYVALFAVLHRHLTGAEVAAIADHLVDGTPDAPIERDDIESAIERVAREHPDPSDVARVVSRLAAGGWPLAEPSTELD
nr:DUF3349 domain-containing protein [Nocardia bovistercoris]